MVAIGPAKPLFEKPYYEKIRDALKPDGILCSQGQFSVINVFFFICLQVNVFG